MPIAPEDAIGIGVGVIRIVYILSKIPILFLVITCSLQTWAQLNIYKIEIIYGL